MLHTCELSILNPVFYDTIMFATCPRRYMIPRYTDIEQFFSINSEDGMIVTTRPLDRETQPWHNISVSATEIGTHTHTQRVTQSEQIWTDLKVLRLNMKCQNVYETVSTDLFAAI